MPKLSRKKRNASPAPDTIDHELDGTSIFDHFPNAPQKEAATKTKEQPSVDDLMKQLSEMNTKLEAQDAAIARQASMRQPETQAPVTVIEEPKLNLEGLPDPVTHAAEYAQAVIQRGRQYDQAMNDYTKRKSAPAQSMGDPDALYQDFAESYPDYADQDTRMRFVTGEVSKRLAQRGVDVTRYMFTQPDRFFKDLTKEYDKTFGKPDDDDDGGEVHVQAEQVRPRKQRARSDDDDGDDGRTAGILSPENRGPRRPTVENEPTGMVEDLRELQRRSGYF